MFIYTQLFYKQIQTISMANNSNGNNLLIHYQCSEEQSFIDNSFNCDSDYYHDHQSFTDQMTAMCKPTSGEPSMVEVKERKRGLRRFQIDWLERSFQEEVKLDPERKMKLSQELGLHPRQVAIWFQNRRSRWKTKQLEQLYQSLKQEYHAISTEKQNLQEEVTKLRAKLEDLERDKHVPTNFMDGSFTEGTGECTSVLSQSSNRMIQEMPSHNHMVAGWSYLFKDDNKPSSAVPPYWPCGLPVDHP